MKTMMVAAALVAAFEGQCQSVVDIATTTSELCGPIMKHGEMPLAIGVGKGFKMSPAMAEIKCVSNDRRASWYDNHQDESCTNVMIVSETTRAEERAGCDINDLVLEDVSCNPPRPGGPDGRVWVHLVCGNTRSPIPYDWQLARLSNNQGDIFVYTEDPTYAYVMAENGTYQAGAVGGFGEINLVFTVNGTPTCN